MVIAYKPSMKDVYEFFRSRSPRSATWFEILSTYPYYRGTLRSRVNMLVHQGYIVPIGKDEWRFSEVYL